VLQRRRGGPPNASAAIPPTAVAIRGAASGEIAGSGSRMGPTLGMGKGIAGPGNLQTAGRYPVCWCNRRKKYVKICP
jgi:hypothetical protein